MWNEVCITKYKTIYVKYTNDPVSVRNPGFISFFAIEPPGIIFLFVIPKVLFKIWILKILSLFIILSSPNLICKMAKQKQFRKQTLEAVIDENLKEI